MNALLLILLLTSYNVTISKFYENGKEAVKIYCEKTFDPYTNN